MKNLVFLLPLLFSVSCVAYVEEIPSEQYCEIEYVETDYHGLVIPFLNDQKWYRDVVPCAKVSSYRQISPIVYFSSWHGIFEPNHQYHHRIRPPRHRMKRRTRKYDHLTGWR